MTYDVRTAGFAGLTVSRTHGIRQGLPITLSASIPALSPDGTCPSQTGLARMARLYKHIDGTFIELRNGVRRQVDPSWVHELQMSLHELAPNYIEPIEGQTVEVIITQHWLRAIIWQLCSSQELMNSLNDESVLFLSPSCVAKDLQIALQRLTQFAIVHVRVGSLVSLLVNLSDITSASVCLHPAQAYRNHPCHGWRCCFVDGMLPMSRVRRSVD